MEFELNIKMNHKLFLRDPQSSALGKSIVSEAVVLIDQLGFEEFTFKKLAKAINTTEAGVYRFFENKHKLLLYLLAWYWSYMEYKISFCIQNIKDPEQKIKIIIGLLVDPEKSHITSKVVDEIKLNRIIVAEGSKSYLTKRVAEENRDKLFKPYKDICALFAKIILEYDAKCMYPQSLASTIIETSHIHKFYSFNLPSLSNIKPGDNNGLIKYLEFILFSALKTKKK